MSGNFPGDLYPSPSSTASPSRLGTGVSSRAGVYGSGGRRGSRSVTLNTSKC